MTTRLGARLRVAAAYFRRRSIVPGGPIEITLESTSKCNLYCPMCPRQIYTFHNENMDLGLYRKIIQECKTDVEFVWPYGIGEPLLHPSIFEMIRLTREAGIRTGLSTNATLLDDARAALLLDCGLDYVILAFDGARKETYEKYRAGAVFEETREKILRFLDMKRKRGAGIYVVLQMVILKDNVADMHAYRRLWDLPGVDEVRFKRDEIQINGAANSNSALKGRRANPCYVLWRGPLYVRHDGQVFPCCYMYADAPVGDLKKQSLREVWNSPGMISLREAHLHGDLRAYPACANCQGARPSLPAVYGSLFLGSLTVRKLVPMMEKLGRRRGFGVFEKRRSE